MMPTCEYTTNKLLLLLATAASSRYAFCNAQTLSNAPDRYFGVNEKQEYLDWEASSTYETSLFLPTSPNDDDNGVAVHWTVIDDTISLAVAARASGWVAFGLSENGGMFGSDVVAFEAAVPGTLRDLHILDDRDVVEDTCNNWKLKDEHVLDDYLIFEASRALDPQDPQDRAIIDDKDPQVPLTRIIAAWGDDEVVSYHGTNNARGAVRFFGSDEADALTFEQTMARLSTGSFFVGASNHSILAVDTDYPLFCTSTEDILKQLGREDTPNTTFTLIGMEPVVDPANVQYVHHFTVSTSSNSVANAAALCSGGGANEDDDDDGDESFSDLVYVWAPGESAFALPENIGLPYGPGEIQAFQIEIHYNNPELVSGAIDNSGVRFYFSEEPREEIMGILQLGDPFVALYGQPVGNEVTEHTFGCPGECSNFVIDEPVTVIREYLHMHALGARMTNQQIRDGEIIHEGTVDTFDFKQQGAQAVQQAPYQIRPGDGFSTQCTFRGSNNGVFGLSSSEEMCIAFLLYWPRKKISGFPWICPYELGEFFPECNAAWNTRALSNGSGRNFGTPPPEGTCPAEGTSPSTAATEDGNTSDATASLSLLSAMAAVVLSQVALLM